MEKAKTGGRRVFGIVIRVLFCAVLCALIFTVVFLPIASAKYVRLGLKEESFLNEDEVTMRLSDAFLLGLRIAEIDTGYGEKTYPFIESFRPVRKLAIGYGIRKDDYAFRDLIPEDGGAPIGRLYSFPATAVTLVGDEAVEQEILLHIVVFLMRDIPFSLTSASWQVDNKSVNVQYGGLFTTDAPIGSIHAGTVFMTVGEEVKTGSEGRIFLSRG